MPHLVVSNVYGLQFILNELSPRLYSSSRPPLGSVVLCLALGNDSTIISEPFLLPYVILTPPESPAHCLTVGNVTFNVLISLAQNNLTSVLVL